MSLETGKVHFRPCWLLGVHRIYAALVENKKKETKNQTSLFLRVTPGTAMRDTVVVLSALSDNLKC